MLTSFYTNLHTYLSALHRPLNASTSPNRVFARIESASNPYTTSPQISSPSLQPIYDLVYDPLTLTIHSSLPNIPEPGATFIEGNKTVENARLISDWSRADALNVHSAILDCLQNTREEFHEIERTGKTNRGWWVVWMRLPASSPVSVVPPTDSEPLEQTEQEKDSNTLQSLREAFLIRRSRESGVSSGTKSNATSGSFNTSLWRLGMGSSTQEKMGGAAAGWGPKGLAEGIGVDARKYVEGLLSLNR
jgi:hypothetical protein